MLFDRVVTAVDGLLMLAALPSVLALHLLINVHSWFNGDVECTYHPLIRVILFVWAHVK